MKIVEGPGSKEQQKIPLENRGQMEPVWAKAQHKGKHIAVNSEMGPRKGDPDHNHPHGQEKERGMPIECSACWPGKRRG